MKAYNFTREELYKMVWEEPMTSIAQKYNLEYQTIKKACSQWEIPSPKAGYWMKLRYGKKIIIPQLKELKNQPKEFFENDKLMLLQAHIQTFLVYSFALP